MTQPTEPIRRNVTLDRDVTVYVNAYTYTDCVDFQLVFLAAGVAITFSGITRENTEALRDALNVLLVETQP